MLLSSDRLLSVEPTGHYWVSAVEPDDNSPTKNDIKDAKVVAKLVIDGRHTESRVLFELGLKKQAYGASKVLGPHREAQLQAAAKSIHRLATQTFIALYPQVAL